MVLKAAQHSYQWGNLWYIFKEICHWDQPHMLSHRQEKLESN